MHEETTMEITKTSVHELARRAVASNQSLSEFPDNSKCKIVAHFAMQALKFRLDSMGIDTTVGIPLSDDKTLICAFENSVLEKFFVLTTIGVEKKQQCTFKQKNTRFNLCRKIVSYLCQ